MTPIGPLQLVTAVTFQARNRGQQHAATHYGAAAHHHQVSWR